MIHIDQHRDSRVPANFISEVESRNPDKVYQYARDFLNVGNFIPPAIKTGLIDQVIFLDSQKSLEEFNIEIVLNHNVILDIDLDFFSPDLDYIGNDLKIKTIQQLIPHAKLITIATSPFFINQELALEKLNMLL